MKGWKCLWILSCHAQSLPTRPGIPSGPPAFLHRAKGSPQYQWLVWGVRSLYLTSPHSRLHKKHQHSYFHRARLCHLIKTLYIFWIPKDGACLSQLSYCATCPSEGHHLLINRVVLFGSDIQALLIKHIEAWTDLPTLVFCLPGWKICVVSQMQRIHQLLETILWHVVSHHGTPCIIFPTCVIWRQLAKTHAQVNAIGIRKDPWHLPAHRSLLTYLLT